MSVLQYLYYIHENEVNEIQVSIRNDKQARNSMIWWPLKAQRASMSSVSHEISKSKRTGSSVTIISRKKSHRVEKL